MHFFFNQQNACTRGWKKKKSWTLMDPSSMFVKQQLDWWHSRKWAKHVLAFSVLNNEQKLVENVSGSIFLTFYYTKMKSLSIFYIAKFILHNQISRTYISQIDVKILKLKYYFFKYLERNVFFGYFCSRTAAVFFFRSYISLYTVPYISTDMLFIIGIWEWHQLAIPR